MADTKITSLLTPQVTTNPATDVLPIVNIADTSMASSGSTRKITVNTLLGAGGTATLASATITGDLTVDTSTLKVDSSNDRVGFGTASPAQFVHLSKSNTSTALTSPPVGGASLRIQNSSSTNNNFGSVEFYNAAGLFGASVNCQYTNQATPTNDLVFVTRGSSGGLEHYRIAADGVATWSEVGGVAGTAMTLNSTGLGVGESPVSGQKLSVNGSGSIRNGNKFYLWDTGNSTAHGIYNSGDNLTFFKNNGTASMTLDASGNLLVGTTTSLQNTSHSFKALGTTNSFWASTFQHDGTVGSPRLLGWRLPNSSDSNAYFVYAINSGGNCFNVFGNGSVNNSTGTYGTISDLRLKENISDARNYLADLLKLRVVKYSLKSEQSAVATKLGFVAQEVEQVFPTLVETNGDDVKSIKTSILIPMLLKAIQELTARVQTLEAK